MRDIDNAVIISVKVKQNEIIASGDVVYFSPDGITKTPGSLKTWGVVIDEDNNAQNRLVCVAGQVELPFATGSWFDGQSFYWSPSTGQAISGSTDNQQINGLYVRGKALILNNYVFTKT